MSAPMPDALPHPSLPRVQWPLVRTLIVKDWQLFEKQLAAYVLLAVLSLGLIATAKPWSFYAGALLLVIVLVALACFSISNALINERRDQTLAFIMSLPVSPLDMMLSKLGGNVLTFLAPVLGLWAATFGVVMTTPIPDGFAVFATLVFGHVTLAFALSLAVAMSVRSEGWNIFVMIASQVLLNPFIMALGQIEAIAAVSRSETLSWPAEALAILAAQLAASVAIVASCAWWHGRKPAFD